MKPRSALQSYCGSSVAIVGLALALTACSSTSNSAASGSAATSSSPSAAASSSAVASSTGSAAASACPAYDGPEKGLPTSVPTPTVKDGTTFKVGFMNPQAANPGLALEQAGAEEQAKALGGTFAAINMNDDPAAQLSGFNDLISQQVTTLITQPVNPQGLTGPLEQLGGKIPVIAEGTPGNAEEDNLPGFDVNILQGFDTAAYELVNAAATARPGGSFALVGFAQPYPGLIYFTARQKYWAEKCGLTFLGQVDTQAPTSADGQTAMNTIVSRYPDAQIVFTWLDDVAQGAISVAESSGKDILITGMNGQPTAVEQVASGKMYATYRYNFPELGKAAVDAGYNLQTKQNLPLAPKYLIPGELITKDNAS